MKKKWDTWDIKPSETSINEGVGGGVGEGVDLTSAVFQPTIHELHWSTT